MLQNGIRLKLQGLSEIIGSSDIYLLMLVDPKTFRQLVIPCDEHIRYQIQMRMEGKMKHLPILDKFLPEVLVSVISQDAYSQYILEIYDFKEGEFMTRLLNTTIDKAYQIRCSDAALLTLISDIPLYVDADIMARQAVPFLPGSNKVALPVNVITDEMLQMSLDKAIEIEDYETASNLRDELKRRHPAENNGNDKEA